MVEAGAVRAPVTGLEFARLLRPLLPKPLPASLAVAVSGGADSMALALLGQSWANKNNVTLTALIVDHRLRKDSSAEARQVAAWLKARGIRHRILVWQHDRKPAANRQAAAREARYALLQAHCRKIGIRHLLLGHHRDDQAETLLLRSLRGSGVDGLAGMAAVRALGEDLLLLRPLLGIPKARLVVTLHKARQAWVDDPSNADSSYARVRVRQALDLLSNNDAAARAELVGHLAQTAANLGRARSALSDAAYGALRAAAVVSPAGIAWLDPAPLCSAADEVGLRALARLLMAIGGQALPPRLERLERLLGWLRAAAEDRGAGKPETLHRCALRPQQDGRILVCRETRHLPPPLALRPGQALLWDGRFRVSLPRRPPAGLVLAPLGSTKPPGFDQSSMPRDGMQRSMVPRTAWASLPALWRGPQLIAVPGLDWGSLPAHVTLVFRPAAVVSGTPPGWP